MPPALPDKQFFKIGEVSELVGVKAHVLRYWESEFRSVRPMKTRGAHRMYRRADVELLCLIRRLLYEDGYTIPGAKKKVREIVSAHAASKLAERESSDGPVDVHGVPDPSGQPAPAEGRATRGPVDGRATQGSIDARAARELTLRAELLQVRADLSALLEKLDHKPAPEAAAVDGERPKATVFAVVAKTTLMHQRDRD